MIEAFSSTLGERLADRWIAALFSPAFAFWGGGVVAWATTRPHGWARLEHWFERWAPAVQLALAVVALLLVVVSGVAVGRCRLAVLRALEGYWPAVLDPVREQLVSRAGNRRKELRDRFMQALASSSEGTAPASAARESIALELRLDRFPDSPDALMPTRLGNVLRASERRTWDRYGLDAVRCWPRMWLLLPADAKQEVSSAQAAVDASVALWSFAALFAVWVVWAWWAPLVGLTVAVAAYASILSQASVFGTLVEASFDLYRTELYRMLRWPVPPNPAEERAGGRALSSYLARGSDDREPVFVDTASGR